MKKILAILLACAMIFALAACASTTSNSSDTADTNTADTTTDAADTTTEGDTTADATTGEGKTIGIAMPTQSSERWINDGANMKAQLESLGYEVVLQYAEDDVQMQVSQIENMVAQMVDCLVIAAVDSGALTAVEAQAKAAGIPIIAYDRLLMDTDAVSYYASFDNKGVGTAIASCYIGGAATSGGVGTIIGAVVGAFIMGILNIGMSLAGFDTNVQKIVKGAVLLGAVTVDLVSKRKKG